MEEELDSKRCVAGRLGLKSIFIRRHVPGHIINWENVFIFLNFYAFIGFISSSKLSQKLVNKFIFCCRLDVFPVILFLWAAKLGKWHDMYVR